MKTVIEKFRSSKQSDITNYKKYVVSAESRYELLNNKIAQYIPSWIIQDDLVSCWWWTQQTVDQLYVVIPWIPEFADKISLSLQRFGWRVVKTTKTTLAGSMPEAYIIHEHYALPGVSIKINMESGKEESTCKLIQTGMKITEQPIWEVRCGDGY